MAAETPPWEPDSRWHPARREAFVMFRDAPERSYKKVARALRKSETIIGRWGGEDGWQDRVRAWEQELDRRRREEFEDESARIGEVLAADAARLRAALLEPARAVVRRVEAAREAGEDPFAGSTVPELVRLAATAGRAFAQVATVERLARGLSTENLGGHDGGPLAADVEAKSMAEVQAYLTGRADAQREREAAP